MGHRKKENQIHTRGHVWTTIYRCEIKLGQKIPVKVGKLEYKNNFETFARPGRSPSEQINITIV